MGTDAKCMNSALFSKYVIDGVREELTPARILGDETASDGLEKIVDETIDSVPGLLEVDPSKVEEYLHLCETLDNRRFPIPFASEYTRSCIAASLIDALFCEGNFRLDDLSLTIKWTSNEEKIGNMAAFYHSVVAAVEYIDALGVSIRRYSYAEGEPSLKVDTPYSGAPLKIGGTVLPDPASWLVYIPFETSEYRLGGSRLAQALGLGGGSAPQLDDPDYFIDCYEIVRELVEDGVAVSGARVGGGGLVRSLYNMRGTDVGLNVDISGIMEASQEKNVARVLFAEVPGVLLQVKDSDFDYIDAECLLQDIAFFPLGHPIPGSSEVRIKSSARSGIQNILESLMHNAEGED